MSRTSSEFLPVSDQASRVVAVRSAAVSASESEAAPPTLTPLEPSTSSLKELALDRNSAVLNEANSLAVFPLNWQQPLQSVVVAIDRSILARAELTLLGSLRLDVEAVVVLAHVIPTAALDPDRPLDRPLDPAAEPYVSIETQLEAYRAELPCRTAIEIVSGDPATELVRLAKLYRADLIVMGNRGLSGMDRILSGSVSTEVTERAPCSVLVVKQT